MTESTSTNNSALDVGGLKARFDALTDRAQAAADALQAAMPLGQRPAKAQQAFLLAYADLQVLQHLCEEALKSITGLDLEALTAEQLADADSLTATMAELCQDLIEAVVDQFGVSRDIVMPTCLLTLVRELDMVETVVVRMEKGVAEINAD